MTGAQRSISLSIRARSSSGEEPTGSISWVANFSRSTGWRMISATSLLNSVNDRPWRAGRCDQAVPSIGFHMMPLSLSVGTSGK